MKKHIFLTLVAILPVINCCTNNQDSDWSFKEGPLTTRWAPDIDVQKPWNLYPRPMLTRDKWVNLNGLWDFAITDKSTSPGLWDRQILVPYPVESALSGIMERVDKNQMLWYKREIKIPSDWKQKRLLLNFEASDWETTLYINDVLVGSHRGGFDPFTFDISDFVVKGKLQEIKISVWDPTDSGTQPRGKQVSDPHGIWYTPSSGIWQTIWLEPVDQSYIKSFRIETDIEKGEISLTPDLYNGKDGLVMQMRVLKDGKVIAEADSEGIKTISIELSDFELWTPDNPNLYQLEIELQDKEEVIDKISSYTGLRKVSLEKTNDGFTRIMLNNEFLFQNGPLDQGFWPDGLYLWIREPLLR